MVALQWDSSKWRPVDGTWKSYVSYPIPGTSSTSYVMSDITSGGAYDHVDIRQMVGANSGYLRGTIEATTTGDVSGSSQIYAKYVHNLISGTIGINFGPFGTIGVTGTSTYDEMGAMKTFSY